MQDFRLWQTTHMTEEGILNSLLVNTTGYLLNALNCLHIQLSLNQNNLEDHSKSGLRLEADSNAEMHPEKPPYTPSTILLTSLVETAKQPHLGGMT